MFVVINLTQPQSSVIMITGRNLLEILNLMDKNE